MIANKNTFKYSCLRLGLLLGALGWLISFVFTVTSWQTSTAILYGMGAKPIEYQPLLDYWLKMASSLFACVGGLFLICLMNIKKYAVLIPLLAYGSIFVGMVLLFAALNNSLESQLHPTFMVDIPFCFAVGVLLLYGRKSYPVLEK